MALSAWPRSSGEITFGPFRASTLGDACASSAAGPAHHVRRSPGRTGCWRSDCRDVAWRRRPPGSRTAAAERSGRRRAILAISGEALNWSRGTVIVASQSVELGVLHHHLGEDAPHAVADQDHPVEAVSEWLGSSCPRALTSDWRNRAAEPGIGWPVG